MRAVAYAFREAWSNLWRRGRATGFAIAAITLATLVLGALLLVTWNIDQWLARWSASSELSVFLRDEATSEQRGAIESAIDQSGIAEGREYVSKEQALRRFRTQFTDLAPLADGLDTNPFPASIEVRIRPAAEQRGQVAGVVTRLAAMSENPRPSRSAAPVDPVLALIRLGWSSVSGRADDDTVFTYAASPMNSAPSCSGRSKPSRTISTSVQIGRAHV